MHYPSPVVLSQRLRPYVAIASVLAGLAGLAGATGIPGCAGAPAPPPVIAKGVPPRAEAEQAIAAFFVAANQGDAALTAFFRDHWTSRLPSPENDPERAGARRAQRRMLGTVEARGLTLTNDRVRVDACSAGDGWLTIDFFFEAAAPHKLTGVKATPAIAPPNSELCASAASPRDDDALRAAIDAYAMKRTASDDFSGVILLARHGKPIFARAYGEADRGRHIPNTLDTKFNIGSSSKMFTAVSLGQLVERGKLRFEDLAATWADHSFHPRGFEAVTIAELLSHTSGLGDVFRPPFFEIRDRLRTPKDYLDAFGEAPLTQRGTWKYSNLGYMVLGRIIERASGEDYDVYVQRHIWTPAGMTGATNARHDLPIPQRAIAYTHKTKSGYSPKLQDAAFFDLPAGTPAGCSLATAADLLSFTTALLAGKLVAPATLDTLTTGRAIMEAPGGILDGRYAYGFMEDRRGGVRHFGHGGGLPGANAYVEMLPDRDEVIIVLANTDPPAATWIAERILAWMLDF